MLQGRRMQDAGCRMQGNKITGLEYKLCEECKKERVKFSVNILESTLSFSFFSPDLSFLKLFFSPTLDYQQGVMMEKMPAPL